MTSIVMVLYSLSTPGQQPDESVSTNPPHGEAWSTIHSARESIRLEELTTDSLRFDQPVWMEQIPGVEGRHFIILEHRTGKAWRLSVSSDDAPQKELFGDWSDVVSDGPWEGLMCVAFHPDYPVNGRFFIKHESIENGQRKTVLEERSAAPDRRSDSGAARRVLLEIPQPADNHNGGTIRFGHDGFLYMAMGDGGPQEDPNGYSQSGDSLLGKMLRIDVDSMSAERPYGIPEDNPFLDRPLESNPERTWAPEIWACGFREPWRFSFDRSSGEILLGDVGQNQFEEVCRVRRGENHGWNVLEAWTTFSDQYRRDNEHYIGPLFAYDRKVGTSITGGYVYRGARYPLMNGVYLFADFYKSTVWALRPDSREKSPAVAVAIGKCPSPIASFGEDLDGELYIVGYDGRLWKIGFDDFTQPPI